MSGALVRLCGWASVAVAAAGIAVPPAGAAGPDRILTWQQTVRLEHEDRTRRLQSLAERHLRASPRFYEALVDRRELPASFGVDIPILRVVFDQRVFFDTDRDAIRPEAEAVIDLVAEALRREASDTAIFIAGHTDSRGSDGHNHALSVRRAESVALALGRRGVRHAHIWRVGFGEAVPLVPNTSDANLARNRRVEFIFGRKPDAVARWLAKQEALVCTGAGPAERAECLRALAVLPPVEAVPVDLRGTGRSLVAPPTTGALPVVPPEVARSLVPVAPEAPAPAVAPASPPATVPPPAEPAPTTVTPAPPARTVVTIRPDEPVLIDPRLKRVLVERLER